MPAIETTPELVRKVYETLERKVAIIHFHKVTIYWHFPDVGEL